MDAHIMTAAIAIIVLVVMSAYFSATETAFTSLNRIKIKNMAQDGDKRAQRVLRLSENYDSLLSSILIGNNIVNILMTAIDTALFIELYGSRGTTIATIVITVVVLVFGEISPKSLAKESAESFSMFSAPIIKICIVILTPLNFIFSGWKKLLNRVFHTGQSRGMTEDELITIVEEATAEGDIEEDQSELIQNAIEFNELEAGEVMTPRVDIMAIDIEMSKEEASELFRKTGFSRMPVFEDDLDHIIGVLNHKDFHNYVIGTEKEMSDFVKPVVFVAETMKIADLLKRMQSMKTHIAIIVDEYGGTEGLVTMEDILEELVGDIWDDTDVIVTECISTGENTYEVACDMNIDDFFEEIDFVKPEDFSCEYTTMGGWAIEMLDSDPHVGDSFRYENLFVIVAQMKKECVAKLTVLVEPEPVEDEGEL
jgi:CBS domain containing-hemolysin-like protein